MDCIIYQGFLQKTPPLDKLIVTWKKRWFVLSQRDPFDPRSVELTYYGDSTLSDKKGTIDMKSITRIHPSPSKSKGHVFSIEIKDKKIMLKADDARTKNIWIAKLYEFAGQGHNYHVTVPHQQLADYNEGLLQLSRADSQISIVQPTTSSTPILNIPYSKIRRFGYQVVLESYDVIWFEICSCKSEEQEFSYFVVASGMDRAMLIAGDLKTKIEKDTGKFLIAEEDKYPGCSYISRNHYGCPPYPKLGRERMLHAGLVNLEATKIVSSSGVMARRGTTPLTPNTMQTSSERRNTVQNLLGTTTPILSPRHSPVRSPSPARSNSPNPPRGTSLQDIAQRSPQGNLVPGSTSDPTVIYTGRTLSALDQSRRTEGQYLALSDGAKSLSNWKNKRQPEANFNTSERKSGKKLSLADLQIGRAAGASNTRRGSSDKHFPSKDSGIGTSADLVLDHDGRVVSPFHSPNQSPSPYSKGRKTSQPQLSPYDHLGPHKKSQASYDHLPPPPPTTTTTSSSSSSSDANHRSPPIPPRSNVSLGASYVEF